MNTGKPESCKILVTGAARSGKSSFVLDWAQAHPAPWMFVATAKALDQEMAERISKHKAQRAQGWVTREEPVDLERALLDVPPDISVTVVDCVTLWLSNLIMEGLEDREIERRGRELCEVVRQAARPLALVTNEVGWGIVPENPLGRRFRDLSGALNQMLAQAVDKVVLMVAGLPLTLKPHARPKESW